MWKDITITGFADEIDSSLDRQITALQKLNINHIEMRGVNGKGLVAHSIPAVKELKKRLDAEGFALSAVGSPIGKIGITDDFAPHMELFRHTVEIAHLMEAPYIRMFSFYLPENDAAPYRSKVWDQLGRLVDYAKAQDAVLLHENEKDIYGDTAPRCLELLQAFAGPHFQAVFDFANFVQCGQPVVEAYELLKPYIAYIHVKDAKADSGEIVPAGMGDGQVREILSR